jgi:hypothetical protein
MPIDWTAVNWVNLGLLSSFAFVASLVGNVIAFRSKVMGAVLTAILFAAIFIFWNHYPHGTGVAGR